ncbi:hypothetical protein STEG23_021779 [Scotinomys teguina]
MELPWKIFGDADTAMPVIKQLAFENANKYCKEALRAHKDKILNNMIGLCRDIDGNHITGQFWQLPFDRDLVEIQGLDQRVVLDVDSQDILVRTVPMANNRPGRQLRASVQNAKRGSIGVMSVAPNMMLKPTPYSQEMNREELEVRDSDAPGYCFLVQATFSYPGFFVSAYEVENCSFQVCEELSWYFDGDCIKSVDSFWNVPCIPILSKAFIMKKCWILSNAFSASNEMTMCCYISNFISDFISLDALSLHFGKVPWGAEKKFPSGRSVYWLESSF